VFLSREIFTVWAQHLYLEILEYIGARNAVADSMPLGQSVCVLQKP
jgi:hypothetical protein